MILKKNKKGVSDLEILLMAEIIIGLVIFYGFVSIAQERVNGEGIEHEFDAKEMGMYMDLIISSPYPAYVKYELNPLSTYKITKNIISVHGGVETSAKKSFFINQKKKVEEKAVTNEERLYLKNTGENIEIKEEPPTIAEFSPVTQIDTQDDANTKTIAIDPLTYSKICNFGYLTPAQAGELISRELFDLSQQFQVVYKVEYGGIKLSRQNDDNPLVQERINTVSGSDMLIGIRVSDDDSELNELKIYFDGNSLKSRKFAEIMKKELSLFGIYTDQSIIGILNDYYYEELGIFESDIEPQIYINLGNINNKESQEFIQKSETKGKIIAAINNAIKTYYE